MLIADNLVQLKNSSFSMAVTPLGMLIADRLVQK